LDIGKTTSLTEDLKLTDGNILKKEQPFKLMDIVAKGTIYKIKIENRKLIQEFHRSIYWIPTNDIDSILEVLPDD